MVKVYNLIIKKLFDEERKLLYGDNSEIIINKIEYVLSKKTYLIDVTVKTDLTDEVLEVYNDGVDYIISQSWVFFAHKNPPIVSVSFIYF